MLVCATFLGASSRSNCLRKDLRGVAAIVVMIRMTQLRMIVITLIILPWASQTMTIGKVEKVFTQNRVGQIYFWDSLIYGNYMVATGRKF